MAERKSVVRTNSFAVQGSSSWVKLRKLSFGQVSEFQAMSEQGLSAEDETTHLVKLVETQVIDWNWVDDDGEKMPIPSEMDNIDNLTAEEFNFLLGEILEGVGSVEHKEKKDKKAKN